MGPDSVAIFWYKGNTRLVANGDHWVCAVAADAAPLRVHIACSIRRSDDGRLNDRMYQETHHKGSNRYSNDWVDASMGCRIMEGFTLQVVRSQPSDGSGLDAA